MWELWIKFYLGQNEYGSQGDSTADSSERLLQRSCAGRSLWMILVKECVLCCAKSLQSSQTLQDTMDCSPPGSSVLGFLQTRILKWTSTNMKWLKSHFILRGVFPTQGSNLCLLHGQVGSLPLEPPEGVVYESKHVSYKRLSASHEQLMSPWRDLVLS